MPLQVGITGAIGSGKTTVCHIFASLGVPIFYADEEAKKTYLHKDIKEQVIHILGDAVYNKDNTINKKELAEIIFNNKVVLQQLNSIIHPRTQAVYEEWLQQYDHHPYIIKEAALLIESGSYKTLDYLIGVQCPEAIRIERAMNRSSSTREHILDRMKHQLSENEKMSYCNFIIQNNNYTFMIPQALAIHERLLKENNEDKKY